MKIKAIIGIILVIVSFIYIIKNPSQSMMEGVMKNRKKRQEKESQALNPGDDISPDEQPKN